MKLTPAPDDTCNTMMIHRMVSENNIVEIGVYRVLFGWRVRAGFIGDMSCVLDWCGGGNWTDVERLYSLCFAILSTKDENRRCFDGVPCHSAIKPFYLDHEFVRVVGQMAGDFKLITLS